MCCGTGAIVYNSIVVLGPTACGKTGLGVALAAALNGEIVSADSRQVYRYLDIGSGKDLAEYSFTKEGRVVDIPYHLIDVAELPQEYNVYDYQQDAYKAISSILSRGKLPVIVGGTGMYLDALIRGYDLVSVPTNEKLRKELAGKSMEELSQCLLELRGSLHNHTDLTERHRLLRAIEIASFQNEGGRVEKSSALPPDFSPLILGTTFPRDQLRQNIKRRLRARLKDGLIQEVQGIHDGGISWARLERLGLEYKFVAQFLQGVIATENELFSQLNVAIGQFAKRQETWFRGMERKGVKINWLSPGSLEKRLEQALEIISTAKI